VSKAPVMVRKKAPPSLVPNLPPVRGGGLKVVRGYHYAAGERDGEKGREYFEARCGRGPQCGDACPITAAAWAIRAAVEELGARRKRG
jgi:hypothetical protein